MKSNTAAKVPTVLSLGLLCVCVFVVGIAFLVSAQKYAAFYYNQGLHYQGTGDLELAVDNYTKAIKLNPDYAEAYYNRGEVCVEMGEWALAVQDYERYLQLAPSAPDRAEVIIIIDTLESELVP
jgi:tetratricopeptide (TPR) repeat protein